MERAVLEAVAELSARRPVEEGLFGGLRPDPLQLRSLAARRHRDPRGRFADELNALKPGGSFRIGNVEVKSHPKPSNLDKRHAPFSVRIHGAVRATEYHHSSAQALHHALDASARDVHQDAVGGKTRYKGIADFHTQGEGAKGRIPEKGLKDAVGEGAWSKAVEKNIEELKKTDDPLKLDTLAQDLAKNGGKLTPEREALHARIVTLLFQGAEVPKGRNPEILYLGGGPAAGKSSMLPDPERGREGVVTHPDGAVTINPDVVKGMIPEYAAMQSHDVETASSMVHEESSLIARKALEIGTGEGFDIVLDKVKVDLDSVAATGSRNYKRRAAVIFTDPIQAYVDAKIRAKREHRSVPGHYFFVSHAEVAEKFDSWVKSGIDVSLYQRGGSRDVPPKLVAQASGRILSRKSKSGWAQFQEQKKARDLAKLIPELDKRADI